MKILLYISTSLILFILSLLPKAEAQTGKKYLYETFKFEFKSPPNTIKYVPLSLNRFDKYGNTVLEIRFKNEEYKEKPNPRKCKIWEATGYKNEYDSAGKLKRKEIYKLNPNRNFFKEILINKLDSLTYVHTFKYDEKDRLIEKKESIRFNVDTCGYNSTKGEYKYFFESGDSVRIFSSGRSYENIYSKLKSPDIKSEKTLKCDTVCYPRDTLYESYIFRNDSISINKYLSTDIQRINNNPKQKLSIINIEKTDKSGHLVFEMQFNIRDTAILPGALNDILKVLSTLYLSNGQFFIERYIFQNIFIINSYDEYSNVKSRQIVCCIQNMHDFFKYSFQNIITKLDPKLSIREGEFTNTRFEIIYENKYDKY